MAEETRPTMLAPPAVTALRDAALPHRLQMERTVSQDIREEREDLKEAAEHSLNIIMDLDMEGRIQFVSESWKDIIGTEPKEVAGRAIADLVVGNSTLFMDTVRSMKEDDSRSHIIRFAVQLGPLSVLRRKRSRRAEAEELDGAPLSPLEEEEQLLNLEAQGIMVYDRTTGAESHVRPCTCCINVYANCS
jgi:serine/threonine-protein kinase RIM15